MLKQSIRLWSLSAVNLFGINELRYGKDPDKRKRSLLLGIAWIVVGIMLEGYLLATMIGYVMMGLQDILTVYSFMVSSVMVLLFTLLKAGSIIFQLNTYENQVALPVSHSAIVFSRFLIMYTSNLLLTAAVMIPGMIVYLISAGGSILTVVMFLLGIFAAPVIPQVVAVVFSVLIKGISARMKYRSLIEAILMIMLMMSFFVLTGGINSVSGENISMEDIGRLIRMAIDGICQMYPPVMLFERAAAEDSLLSMAVLLLISVTACVLMLIVLQHFFGRICRALNVSRTRNDYKKVTGTSSSLLMSLIKREFHYYFSQSVYMMNTLMGLVLMVAAAVAVVVVGSETIDAQLSINGVVVKMLPYVLAMTGTMMSPAAVSISLEGKTRWLTKTLPIPEKVQYDSKLLMNYLLDAPFYVISIVVAAIGLHVTGFDLLWLILIPAVYLCWGAVYGQTANLCFPNFNWESEVQVVKQGASVLVSMLVSMVSVLLPAGICLSVQVMGQQGSLKNAAFTGNLVNGVVLAIIVLLSYVLYRRNCRKVL